MNDLQVQRFLCLAQMKNMTHAAEKLHMSQQNLSKAIRDLESELGVSLFIRTGEGTELTEIGRKVLIIAEEMEQQWKRGNQTVQSIIRQHNYRLHILLENQAMERVMPEEFMYRVGDFRISTSTASRKNECVTEVENGRFDLSISSKPSDCGSLMFFTISKKPISIIIPKSHPLATKETISIYDLKHVNLSWWRFISAMGDDFFKACYSVGFYPRVVREATYIDSLLEGLTKSNSVALGSSIYNIDAFPDLVRRPLIHQDLCAHIGVLIKPERSNELKISSFIQATKHYNE